MLIFLDIEFTGLDQAKPDLISIGLVAEAGREFYAELPESHWAIRQAPGSGKGAVIKPHLCSRPCNRNNGQPK
jgi:hypothetical protein